MSATPVLPVLLLAALALAGCNVTASSGAGSTTVSSGGVEQLRASVRGPLRRAGVSDACIDQMDRHSLTQARNRTQRSARSSKEVLQRNQQLRLIAERACAEV